MLDEATSKTITHADDLLEFEILCIAEGVSSIYNIKMGWKGDYFNSNKIRKQLPFLLVQHIKPYF